MLGFVLTGCTRNESVNTGQTGYVSGDGSTLYLDVAKRSSVVDFAGTLLDGQKFQLRHWRGNVVVVNVWASWCAPCRSEATALANVYRSFAEQNVEFLGMNTRDSLVAAQAFAKRFDTGYPSVQDADGMLTLAFGNLGPAATPSTIILDKNSRVAARILGPVGEAELRSVIRAVLQDGS